MSCENIQQYDFCTVKDHTVPKWLISSALFEPKKGILKHL